MNEVSKLLTDDCALHFVNGDTIKGAEAVSQTILYCCKEYSKAYMKKAATEFGKGMIIGTVAIGVGIGIYKLIKNHKTKKLEEKTEA